MVSANRMLQFIVPALAVIVLGTEALADRGRADVLIANLKRDPLPKGWTVEGYAFGTPAPGSWRQEAVRTTANQRQYQFGKLTSPEFVIERSYIVMELGGTYHPDKCVVALVVSGKDVRRI